MDLSSLANRSGTFTIAAFDHRHSLAELLLPSNPDDIQASDLVAVKRLFIQTFSDMASAILIDPVYGLDYGLDLTAEVPAGTGLLMSLEAADYSDSAAGRLTHLLPHWHVADVKAHQAAAKLLLYYHPHSPLASQQLDLVRQISRECRHHSVAFLIEPIIYDEGKFSSRSKTDLTLITIDRLAPLVDILKLEFPLDPHRSTSSDWRRVAQDISRHATVPWVLLSRGLDFESFKSLTQITCESGASGIAVGRAVWQEIGAIYQDHHSTQDSLSLISTFLNQVARPRFKTLADIVTSTARPWTGYRT